MSTLGWTIWVTSHALPGEAGWLLVAAGFIGAATAIVLASAGLLKAVELLCRRFRGVLFEFQLCRIAWDERGELPLSLLKQDGGPTGERRQVERVSESS